MSIPAKLAFVDIETTGTSISRDRAIEIAVLRVENNKLTQEFHSLVNPQVHVSPYIEALTGIKSAELENAPVFEEIASKLQDVLSDCLFISHNVRFDYGFIKNEFSRIGIDFSTSKCCTVRLSRHLFPGDKRHDLDSIVERFGFTCKQRHRALDDAKVIWQFFTSLQSSLPKEHFEKSFNYASKRSSFPILIPQHKLETLPETPGVYIFYGAAAPPDRTGTVLYIGKSINIRERVLSHFTQNDNQTDLKICRETTDIDTIQTAGELGALIKEAEMIKKLQPVHNRLLRRRKELIVALKKTNTAGYDTVGIDSLPQINIEDLSNVLGIFKSKRQGTKYLADICKKHNLCPKLLGLEKTRGKCMHAQFGWCRGACIGKEIPVAYNIRLLQAVAKTKIDHWPFDGKITIVERNHAQQTEDSFEINNWCAITDQGESFDVDMYKILRRYLRCKKNLQNIVYRKGSSPPIPDDVPLAFAD